MLLVLSLATALSVGLHQAAAPRRLGATRLSLPDGPPSDVLLRATLSNCDVHATSDWLRRRGFAAVLPIQPMLLTPLQPPLCGIELTFRRKPNSEKGGTDGGLRFVIAIDEQAEDEGVGVLLVTRIVTGQYTTKIFSERTLLRKLVADLGTLPAECGSVQSVVDLTRAERDL